MPGNAETLMTALARKIYVYWLCLVRRKKPRRSDPDNTTSFSPTVVMSGRIFYANAGVPEDSLWFWSLEFHEWKGRKGLAIRQRLEPRRGNGGVQGNVGEPVEPHKSGSQEPGCS